MMRIRRWLAWGIAVVAVLLSRLARKLGGGIGR